MKIFRNNPDIDKQSLNDVIHLLNKILKILFIFLIIAGIYALTLIFKEWNLKHYFLTFLGLLSPLFIGLLIAWLFDPFVSFLEKKKIRRPVGALITYVLLIGSVAIILWAILPMLFDQINDFVKTMPMIFSNIQSWLENFIDSFSSIEGFDTVGMKKEVFEQIENFGMNLTTDLPLTIVNFIQAFISGIGSVLVGLIIGFYLLVGFKKFDMISYLPKRFQKDAKNLSMEMNTSLRSYVQGAFLDCTAIFVITSIGLSFTGLQAPLLFGLFCGITNIIPYAGPYIGGAPAVIVGFAQSPTIGLFTLIVIALIQFIEGNFFQPLIISQTTKLHPVTIMVGLLVFGYFFGILGMLVSTPIIAVIKAIFLYFDQKYEIIKGYKENEEKD